MRNQQSVHKRAKDARWLSHRVGARTRRPQRPQTQGCVIVLAQSFARCETNRASTIRQPRPTSTTTNRHSPAFWCGGCENPQLAGRAWMHDSGRTKSLHDAATQTTANARMRDSACPKFRTMRNQQSKHDSTTPPRYTFAHSTSGVLFLARRVREPATCG